MPAAVEEVERFFHRRQREARIAAAELGELLDWLVGASEMYAKFISESHQSIVEDSAAQSADSAAQGGQADSGSTAEQVEWVQCEAPGCGKWMELPSHVRAASLPEVFVCALAVPWDPAAAAACGQPEEGHGKSIVSTASGADGTASGGGGGRGAATKPEETVLEAGMRLLSEARKKKKPAKEKQGAKKSSNSTASSLINIQQMQRNPSPLWPGQPALMRHSELRPHQKTGLAWLTALWQNGMNGILGDEMGLGKMCQVIGQMSVLKEHKVPGPYLVVAPQSRLNQWHREVEMWTGGTLKALTHHGAADKRVELHSQWSSADVVIVSYEIYMRDICSFKRPCFTGRSNPNEWKLLVTDDPRNRIANTNFHLHLNKIDAPCRLLLLGRLLQDKPREILALLDFVKPNLLIDSLLGVEDRAHWLPILEQQTKMRSKLHVILVRALSTRFDHADVHVRTLSSSCQQHTQAASTEFNALTKRARRGLSCCVDRRRMSTSSCSSRSIIRRKRDSARTWDILRGSTAIWKLTGWPHFSQTAFSLF
jgi:hypothetical protein